jgi:hypothetical protein
MIYFNTKNFLKTILIFVILNFLWTSICASTYELNRLGILSGLGFLLVLPLSFYLGQQIKSVLVFIYLTGIVIGNFCFSSFVLLPFFMFSWFTGVIYAIINSILVSKILTSSLDYFYGIWHKKLTFYSTAFSCFMAYSLASFYKEDWMAMFGLFQFILILPLAFGLNFQFIKKEEDSPHVEGV